MKPAVKIAVTGAAGQIGYSLLPRIAAGEMFGGDQPIILQLLEIPVEAAQKAMAGVAMELEDCAFPLLQDMTLNERPEEAFAGANWALLVGSKPRGPGMERADLLQENGRIFAEQGAVLNEVAAQDCRVVVVGNPCNTNCLIAASKAGRLPRERFTAMTRLDQNRAVSQIARKAGVPVDAVTDLIIYGNHSPTMYVNFQNARIHGRPAPEVIQDRDWLENTFLSTVGKRGAAIIAARGKSSAASAANALIDHVRSLTTPSGTLHSMAVCSDGSYGFAKGVWASLPVRTTKPGCCEIVRDQPVDEFSAKRIAATNEELMAERKIVQELLA